MMSRKIFLVVVFAAISLPHVSMAGNKCPELEKSEVKTGRGANSTVVLHFSEMPEKTVPVLFRYSEGAPALWLEASFTIDRFSKTITFPDLPSGQYQVRINSPGCESLYAGKTTPLSF